MTRKARQRARKAIRAGEKLLAGYGAVTPRNRPEDWKQVEADIEQAIAEDVIERSRVGNDDLSGERRAKAPRTFA